VSGLSSRALLNGILVVLCHRRSSRINVIGLSIIPVTKTCLDALVSVLLYSGLSMARFYYLKRFEDPNFPTSLRRNIDFSGFATAKIHTMPLFSSRNTSDTASQPAVSNREAEPRRHSTLFGRSNRSASPVRNGHAPSGADDANNASPGRQGLLHRRDEDPTINAARQRVASAEAAERDADRALIQARVAVKEARSHIKKLEKEAAEEARLAKIKQNQASAISRRGHTLGRHGPL